MRLWFIFKWKIKRLNNADLFSQPYIYIILYTVKENPINKMLEGQKYLSWTNFIARV